MFLTSNQLRKNRVLLDSSTIIRGINRRAKDGNKHANYHQLKPRYIFPADQELNDSYYNMIAILVKRKEINAMVTYESIHIFEKADSTKIIQLFVNKSAPKTQNKLVYLNQSVYPKLFLAAAEKILEATEIIIDPLFLDFQVGISLTNYIKSSCSVLSLGKTITLQKAANDISVLDQTPEKFVEELFNSINHFD
ncbi:MAG: hypothetical protein IKN50_03590 [Clostridia bacterium]|nr:hypothetical protein [Clostridia bacterium]